MKHTLFTALSIFLVLGVVHANPTDEDTSESLLRIEVKASYKNLQGESDFSTMNATQSNNVSGGDKGFKTNTAQGEGMEFKKWGFIVNALPVRNPNNMKLVDTQFQIELSGPIEGKESVDIETWQLQTEVMTVIGKWKTIARKPGLVKIRITVDDY